MFTGLVEQMGLITAADQQGDVLRLTLRPNTLWQDLTRGDSVAVNGTCLTVTDSTATTFSADLSKETLAKTAAYWNPGTHVNLERALLVTSRIGGHFVSGHVDGTGTITQLRRDLGSVTVNIDAPFALTRYLVPKGSVTVDGVSLTVVKVGGPAGNAHDLAVHQFQLLIVPHTLAVTSLKYWDVGREVNLEVDQLAKYIERLSLLSDFQSSLAQVKEVIL